MTELVEAVDILERVGIIGLLLFLLVGSYRGWIVWGPAHLNEVSYHKDAASLWQRVAGQKDEQLGRALGVVERLNS